MGRLSSLRERAGRRDEDPPENTGYVACRGCGWYGAEALTVWTNNESEECFGDHPEAELSCPMCHSSDLRDAREPNQPHMDSPLVISARAGA